MKIICPECRNKIPTIDINVENDIALCRACDESFSFAELLEESSVPAVDVSRPPKGVWYRQAGNGFEVGTTTRSASAFFLIPFTCFWSGMSMWGIYGTQLRSGKFNPVMSLFGLPFLIGTIVLVGSSLMSVFGKLVVSVEHGEGRIFTGVGIFGWTRRFKWNAIKGVSEGLTKYQVNGSHRPQIELEGEKPLRFGSTLKDERREFMLAVLKKRFRGL